MKILVAVAHPDDEVLGMGGTIKKLSKEGNEIKIIFLSTGILARRPLVGVSSKKTMVADTEKFLSKMQKHVKDLQHDSKKALKILGVDEIEFLDYPDNEMDTVSNLHITKTIENAIDSFRPSIVYSTPQNDVNIDHQAIFQATLTATRPRKNYFVKRVYSFEVLSSTEWFFPEQFRPNVFVNITKEISSKIKAMESYKNEIREFPHPRSKIGIEANARKWGSVSGFNFAEAFNLVRSLEN